MNKSPQDSISWIVYRCLNFHCRYALDFGTTEAVEKLLDFFGVYTETIDGTGGVRYCKA